MDPIDLGDLRQLASKYIWWKTPDEAVDMPDRVMAQVMNIGDFAEICMTAIFKAHMNSRLNHAPP